MHCIGIDFDNTIACYDQLFPQVAFDLGMISHRNFLSKNDVKDCILQQKSGDLTWQRLQGKVYGKYMLEAKLFPGIHEFLYLAKLRKVQVFIISHKSDFGHFDDEKISLRKQALNWLEQHKILGKEDWLIPYDNVFFESTRQLKIERIKSLRCTHFIDDLIGVLTDINFPRIEKLLLNMSQHKIEGELVQQFQSWRQITSYIFHSWTDQNIVNLIENKFPYLNIRKAIVVKGRGNSKVYQLLNHDKKYILKIYPDRQLDTRPRLETESLACEILTKYNYPVPKCVVTDSALGWGIYEWIDGEVVSNVNQLFLEQAFQFIHRLYYDSRLYINEFSKLFSPASEACFSGLEVIEQIEVRREKLMTSTTESLYSFLTEQFDPCYKILSTKAKANYSFDKVLPQHLQILSPSDFGSHNAIKYSDRQIIFFDFEYFGWDDPVKLVSDFYWHPSMNLSNSHKQSWIDFTINLFVEDTFFQNRLNSYLPLYGLRWCLILLNEFIPERLYHRLYAQNLLLKCQSIEEIAHIQDIQLSKAKKILKAIEEMST